MIKSCNLQNHKCGELIVSDSKHYYGSDTVIALIDEEDFARVSEHGWYISHKGYVFTLINNRQMPLHRFILGVKDKRITVDHHDGNKLNNRKSNLITMTNKENLLKSWHEQRLREHLKKPVVMIDCITGDELQIFSSAKEAALYLYQLGKTKKINQGAISNVCNGIRKTSGGYAWRWL